MMKQAILPKNLGGKRPEILEENKLENLRKNGIVVYATPWAMYADRQGLLWLNGNCNYSYRPGGTMKMEVTKKNGQFICDVSNCLYFVWTRSGPDFLEKFVSLPVAEVIGMK